MTAAAQPKPKTVQLVKPIRLVSGREFATGTRFQVVPHPRGAFYGRAAYLARAAFESLGFPCDLMIFESECQVIQ